MAHQVQMEAWYSTHLSQALGDLTDVDCTERHQQTYVLLDLGDQFRSQWCFGHLARSTPSQERFGLHGSSRGNRRCESQGAAK